MTGSGAAQSLRPVCVARRERLRDFGSIASTSAVPPREPSRRRRRLAARWRVSRGAHPASRTPGVDATSECRGTPEVEEKTKRPGSFAESGPLEFRERQARRSDAAASRRGAILGLAMLVRLPFRHAAHGQRDGARERTRAGEGLGVAKGDPAVHDDVLMSVPFRGSRRARSSGDRLVQRIVAFSSDRS